MKVDWQHPVWVRGPHAVGYVGFCWAIQGHVRVCRGRKGLNKQRKHSSSRGLRMLDVALYNIVRI